MRRISTKKEELCSELKGRNIYIAMSETKKKGSKNFDGFIIIIYSGVAQHKHASNRVAILVINNGSRRLEAIPVTG